MNLRAFQPLTKKYLSLVVAPQPVLAVIKVGPKFNKEMKLIEEINV